MKKGILFDLDGTLWDSSREVAISWQEALEKREDVDKEITTEMIQSVMGKSMYRSQISSLESMIRRYAVNCWNIAVRRRMNIYGFTAADF